MGMIEAQDGRLDDAMSSLNAALSMRMRLGASKLNDGMLAQQLVMDHVNLGEVLLHRGLRDEGLKYYERGLEIAEENAARFPGNPEIKLNIVLLSYRICENGDASRSRLVRALSILADLNSSGQLPPAQQSWIPQIEKVLSAAGATDIVPA
jgi:tetratricopeptide (TPR) repeat protein